MLSVSVVALTACEALRHPRDDGPCLGFAGGGGVAATGFFRANTESMPLELDLSICGSCGDFPDWPAFDSWRACIAAFDSARIVPLELCFIDLCFRSNVDGVGIGRSAARARANAALPGAVASATGASSCAKDDDDASLPCASSIVASWFVAVCFTR